MKLSEMRKVLNEEELQLTRSLGQNFLHDSNQLDRIVRAAEVRSGDPVLEIGPGLGPLTHAVLRVDARVLAVEKDARLADYLGRRFAEEPRLELVQADALDFLRKCPRDWSGWKVVSNLPYSVASPILVELAQVERPPDCVVVTLQSEVAQRVAAGPGGGDYGILTLLVQIAFEPQGSFRIPRECFFPVPGVDSTCLRLVRRATPLLPRDQFPMFSRLVKRGFSQRRKMMFKLLKADWPIARLDEAFTGLGISPQTRAERVSLEQFVRLTQWLNPRPERP